MNTKIYFNNKFIFFEESNTQNPTNQALKTYTIYNDQELKKIIFNFIEAPNDDSIKITAGESFKILASLKPFFYYIEAAGGFIEKDQKFLFIHRFGRWDLPKGKLEKNETVENAAVRECEEECAVKDLKIINPLTSTFHIYAYKNSYALKQTFWFSMHTDYSGKLNPQLEESIDQVKWFDKATIQSEILPDTYHTIKDVVTEALEI